MLPIMERETLASALAETAFLFHLLEGETTSSVREIAQYLVEKRIDVIYAQGIRDLWLYARARRLSGWRCRVIVTSHSSYTWQRPCKVLVILGLCRVFADAFVFWRSVILQSGSCGVGASDSLHSKFLTRSMLGDSALGQGMR